MIPKTELLSVLKIWIIAMFSALAIMSLNSRDKSEILGTFLITAVIILLAMMILL